MAIFQLLGWDVKLLPPAKEFAVWSNVRSAGGLPLDGGLPLEGNLPLEGVSVRVISVRSGISLECILVCK